MKATALALAAAIVVAGCVAGGGTPTPILVPITQTTYLDGEVRFDSMLVFGAPINFPVRAWGTGYITIQYPNQPHVIFDGDGGWIIEPLTPQDRPAAEAAMQQGIVSAPVALSPVGTIRRNQK